MMPGTAIRSSHDNPTRESLLADYDAAGLQRYRDPFYWAPFVVIGAAN